MKIETKKQIKVVALIAMAVAAVGLSGCNMISGIGKDIQEASATVKNAIEN